MAFAFGASSANRLMRTASLITQNDPRPVTVAFRLKQNSTAVRTFGVSQWIFNNNYVSGNGFASHSPGLGVAIMGGVTNTLAVHTNGTSYSSATYSPDTTDWHGYAFSWATGAPGATAFYRDAATLSTATATWSAPSGVVNGAGIGVLEETGAPIFNIDGALADFAVWNAVLDSSECMAVTGGFSPLLVRPTALVSYVPLISDSNRDRKLEDWTAFGTLTKQADHPRMFQPAGSLNIARQAATAPPATGGMAFRRPGAVKFAHMIIR